MSYNKKSIFACTPATSRGQAVQLGVDPKGENFLYTNGKTVFIRNLTNPAIAKEYTGHSTNTTVARYSPSGYYVASGDNYGNVRIWDAIQDENILKNEVKVINGRINDLSWDFESKRIIAVGNGKERYGHAFLFDTGSSSGEIIGHSKVINSVSIRQKRPMRAATASDDFTVVFFHGPPFKQKLTIKDHTAFVQGVEFSPDGSNLVTVGSDKKVFLYDGDTGEKRIDLSEVVGEESHKGGIFAVSWSPDSKQLLTSSGDKTVKIWDVEAQKVVRTYEFPDVVDNQQIGNLWAGKFLVSLSLSGDINYLDPNSNSTSRVVKRFVRIVIKTLLNSFKHAWSGEEGSAISISGEGHTNQINQIAPLDGKLFSIGMDDTLRTINVEARTFSEPVVKTNAMPKGIAIKDNKIIVSTTKSIDIIKNNDTIFSLDISYIPTVMGITTDGSLVAVGSEESKVTIYKSNGEKLEEEKVIVNRNAISTLAFSPDGTLLAVGDAQGKIMVYDTNSYEAKIKQWVFHSAKVNCIAWSPDGLHAASGSLDTYIYIWSVEKPMKNIAIKGAHQVAVTGVTFLDNETISSDSVTNKSGFATYKIGENIYNIVDTPGFFDTSRPNEEIIEEIVRTVKKCIYGIKAILFLFGNAIRVTDVERNLMNGTLTLFGEESLLHMITVFSRRDKDQTENPENFEKSWNDDVRRFVNSMGYRWAISPSPDIFGPRTQMHKQHLEKLEKLIVSLNGEYTNEMLEELRKKQEDSERTARETEERIAREAKERIAREVEERIAREVKFAREVEKQIARETEERIARENKERIARENKERIARENKERIAKEAKEKASKEMDELKKLVETLTNKLASGGSSGGSSSESSGGCFSLETRVKLESGKVIYMSELQVGDRVLSNIRNNVEEFSDVYLIAHLGKLDHVEKFTKVSFTKPDGSKGQLRLTTTHYVFKEDLSIVFAKNLRPGESKILVSDENNKLVPVFVDNITNEWHDEYVSFYTRAGSVVADGVLSSCYDDCPPYQMLMDLVFLPIRWWTHIIPSTHREGRLHPYVQFLETTYFSLINVMPKGLITMHL
ncbi:20100_t:CDS:10 [Funneliformis geosporum]|uniref:20100_t:CDS:1 n=1 Tax=Funneliformis geosporum TaxID=1117311 RepID=A0A9W4SR51_9GLOM|nr:20100_t:CDS:10 [Funneliformis geosporum]